MAQVSPTIFNSLIDMVAIALEDAPMETPRRCFTPLFLGAAQRVALRYTEKGSAKFRPNFRAKRDSPTDGCELMSFHNDGRKDQNPFTTE